MLEPQNLLCAFDNWASPSVSTALFFDESTTFAPSNLKSREAFVPVESGQVGTEKLEDPEYSPSPLVMRTLDTYHLKSNAVEL